MTDDDMTTPASFTLTRTLEAPRALVWRAWTDPALTARWWHPAGVEVETGSVAIDLREGGQYAYTMTVDGRRWPTAGTYLEIREPELLRFTWRGPEDADEISPLVTVALEELGAERTRMVFTLERRVPAEAGEDEDVQDGWRSALDEVLVPLLGELAGGSGAGRPRIVLEQLVSADGFAAEPDGGMRFVEAVSFEDLDRTDEHQMEFVATVDAIVLGRVTYEMFSSYWPTADPEHDRLAGPINALPKLVVSETLETAPWGEGEAQLVRGGVDALLEAIAPYGRVVVWGSLTLSRALLAAELVDTIRLRTVPTFVGEGLTFTPPTRDPLAARLGEQWRYSTGHVTTEYHLRD